MCLFVDDLAQNGPTKAGVKIDPAPRAQRYVRYDTGDGHWQSRTHRTGSRDDAFPLYIAFRNVMPKKIKRPSMATRTRPSATAREVSYGFFELKRARRSFFSNQHQHSYSMHVGAAAGQGSEIFRPIGLDVR